MIFNFLSFFLLFNAKFSHPVMLQFVLIIIFKHILPSISQISPAVVSLNLNFNFDQFSIYLNKFYVIIPGKASKAFSFWQKKKNINYLPTTNSVRSLIQYLLLYLNNARQNSLIFIYIHISILVYLQINIFVLKSFKIFQLESFQTKELSNPMLNKKKSKCKKNILGCDMWFR